MMQQSARCMSRVYRAHVAAAELRVQHHPDFVDFLAQNTFINSTLKAIVYHLDYLSRYHAFAEDSVFHSSNKGWDPQLLDDDSVGAGADDDNDDKDDCGSGGAANSLVLCEERRSWPRLLVGSLERSSLKPAVLS